MTAILPLQSPPRIKGGFETIVAGPLKDRTGGDMPEDQWRMGVNGRTLATDVPFTNAYSGGSWGDPDTGGTKDISIDGEQVEFYPSGVGVDFECVMNSQTVLGNIQIAQVKLALQRKLWSLIAHHIANVGTTIACPAEPDTNPTLASVAKLPDGYDDAHPGNIRGVIQGLLDMVCAGAGTDPVFLAPYSYKAQLIHCGLVKWDDALERYTLLQTYPIAFDCIDNVGPSGTTTATDGSEFWIYAMLAPQVTVADEGDGDIVSYRTQLQNVHGVRGERQFGYWFDIDNVYAAKATSE